MAEYIDISRIDDWDNLSIIDDDGYAKYVDDVGELPRADVIEIPEGATNGDMVKAMFPSAKVSQIFPISNDEEVYYVTVEKVDGITNEMRVMKSWWNAPYRKVEE